MTTSILGKRGHLIQLNMRMWQWLGMIAWVRISVRDLVFGSYNLLPQQLNSSSIFNVAYTLGFISLNKLSTVSLHFAVIESGLVNKRSVRAWEQNFQCTWINSGKTKKKLFVKIVKMNTNSTNFFKNGRWQTRRKIQEIELVIFDWKICWRILAITIFWSNWVFLWLKPMFPL